MSTHDYVGAGGSGYPEVAARAVRDSSQQHPSPVYGYFRAPVEGVSHQRIYLFGTLEEARGWFMGLVHAPAQLYDYAAVFVSTDLSQPVPGLESFGHSMMSSTPVGNMWPFLLGLPLGALGGYFYRGWRDDHPGQWIPGISGDYDVGGPWLDIEPYVGGPWLDLVGAEADARERSMVQTRALIESAKRDVIEAQMMNPAVAWVWSLHPPGLSPTSRVEFGATVQLTSFTTTDRAQAYMFEQMSTPYIAVALFDTTATRHWPNPVRWTQSDNPAYESLIAQRVAQYGSPRMAGDYIGAEPRSSSISRALGNVRDRAQTIANRRAGNVVGVLHTPRDNLWHAVAFRDRDDADDWLETVTQDPTGFTYAAYYDKEDGTWPHPVTEKIGGFRTPKGTGAIVGSALDETRIHAKALATAKPGNAAGVLRAVDGTWSAFAFPSLDAAIDWLSGLTAHKGSFVYAGAFEKDVDGTAYVQQEEFGVQVSPSQRALPVTSGEHTWWAA